MSSSSQPRAKSLRGNQKALSKSSLVSVASPPPPKLYYTQWLPIDDSMRGNQDLVKDGVSMPFFQDLKDLDQLRRASQELPEYDRLEVSTDCRSRLPTCLTAAAFRMRSYKCDKVKLLRQDQDINIQDIDNQT